MPYTDPEALARILAVYREAELDMIALTGATLRKNWKATAAHYADSGRELEKLIRAIENRLVDAHGQAGRDIVEAVRHGYATGYDAAGTHTAGPPIIPDQAIQATVLETAGAVDSIRRNILRDVEDVYRDVMMSLAPSAIISGVNRTDRLQQALDRFAARGIKGFTDRAGRRWGIDTYAEMALRTSMNRARNQGRRDGFHDGNVSLIVTSAHKACAPQCVPYQGQILSLDGATGPRVVEAADGSGPVTINVVATLDEAERNGYHHPNCAHIDMPYVPGTPLPEPVDTDREDYEATQTQRRYERNIRAWKRRAAVAEAGSPQQGYAKAKVRQWQKAQRDHLKDYPWLRRRPDRERIFYAKSAARDGLDMVRKVRDMDLTTLTPPKYTADLISPPGVDALDRARAAILSRPAGSRLDPSAAQHWATLYRGGQTGRVSLDRDKVAEITLLASQTDYLDEVLAGRAISPLTPGGARRARISYGRKLDTVSGDINRALVGDITPEFSDLRPAGAFLSRPDKDAIEATLRLDQAALKKATTIDEDLILRKARVTALEDLLNPGRGDATTLRLANEYIDARKDRAALRLLNDKAALKAAEDAYTSAEVRLSQTIALKAPKRKGRGVDPATLVDTPQGPSEGYPVRLFKRHSYKDLDSIERVDPMMFDDIGATVNPKYGTASGYGINCQRVANAAELRRRGYNVQAGKGSYQGQRGYSLDPEIRKGWEFINRAGSEHIGDQLNDWAAYSSVMGWRTSTGEVRIPFKAPRAKKGVPRGVNGMTVKTMEDSVPDGARGFAWGQWSGYRAGHIWNWEKVNGEIRFYEFQTGQGALSSPDEYLRQLKNGSLRMLRVDDLSPTDDIVDVLGVK